MAILKSNIVHYIKLEGRDISRPSKYSKQEDNKKTNINDIVRSFAYECQVPEETNLQEFSLSL